MMRHSKGFHGDRSARVGWRRRGSRRKNGAGRKAYLFNLRVQCWSQRSRIECVAGGGRRLPWHLCTRTCWHTGRRSRLCVGDRNGVGATCLRSSVARDTLGARGGLDSCRRGGRRIASASAKGRSLARRRAHCRRRCRKRRIKRATWCGGGSGRGWRFGVVGGGRGGKV